MLYLGRLIFAVLCVAAAAPPTGALRPFFEEVRALSSLTDDKLSVELRELYNSQAAEVGVARIHSLLEAVAAPLEHQEKMLLRLRELPGLEERLGVRGYLAGRTQFLRGNVTASPSATLRVPFSPNLEARIQSHFRANGKAYREAIEKGYWSRARFDAYVDLGISVPNSRFTPRPPRRGEDPSGFQFVRAHREAADDLEILEMLSKRQYPIGTSPKMAVHDLSHVVALRLYPEYGTALSESATELLAFHRLTVETSDAFAWRLNWALEQLNVVTATRAEIEEVLALPLALRGRDQYMLTELRARHESASRAELEKRSRDLLDRLPRWVESLAGLDAENVALERAGRSFRKIGLERTSFLHAWERLEKIGLGRKATRVERATALARVEVYLLQGAGVTPDELARAALKPTLEKGSALEKLICASGFLLTYRIDFGCP